MWAYNTLEISLEEKYEFPHMKHSDRVNSFQKDYLMSEPFKALSYMFLGT